MLRLIFRRTFTKDLTTTVTEKQAPNRLETWSKSQLKRSEAMSGPRFEQTDLEAQPFAPAAIELIKKQPVIKVSRRIAVCDGGGGALGHPKVYINLDDTQSIGVCGYCGLRYQLDHH